MSAPFLIDVNHRRVDLPIFDPVVAAHLNKESSYLGTLLHQINQEEVYARLFEGRGKLTFLDIGANIGLVSLYALPSCKRIVAVEPSPINFPVLQAMTYKFPQIECVQAALAPVNGPVPFFENDLNSTASSTVNTYGTETKVNGLTLAAILNIYQLEHVDVCKVDAEGAEGESLTLEQLSIAAPVVDTWMIETHNCPKSTWGQKLGRLVNFLSDLGYHHQRIEGMALVASKT